MNNYHPQEVLRRLSGPYRDHAHYPSDKLKQIQQAKRLAVYGHGSGYNSFKAFILNKFDKNIHAVIDAKFTGITKINDITYIATQQFVPPHKHKALGLHRFGCCFDWRQVASRDCGQLRVFSMELERFVHSSIQRIIVLTISFRI